MFPSEDESSDALDIMSIFQTKLLEIEDFVAAMKPVNFRTRALTALHQTLDRLEETSRNLVNKPAEQEDTKEEEAAVTEQAPLMCSICDQTFSRRTFYERHIDGHTRNSCQTCGQSFGRRRSLVLHMIREHQVKEAETVYACPQCDRRFAKKPSLVAHLVRHARDAGRLGCVQCGLACSDAGQLELHRRQQHADAAKFCCRKCGRTFQRQQQYDLHIEGHRNNVCVDCGEDFAEFKSLTRHAAQIHRRTLKRPNRPADGGAAAVAVERREFAIGRPAAAQLPTPPAQLEAPWAADALQEAPALCPNCGVLFSYRQALERHVATCRSTSPSLDSSAAAAADAHVHQCVDCGRRFKSKASLARHGHVHDVQRPFLCHCGRAYKRYKHLQRHLLVRHRTVVRDGDDVDGASVPSP